MIRNSHTVSKNEVYILYGSSAYKVMSTFFHGPHMTIARLRLASMSLSSQQFLLELELEFR